MAVFLLSTKRCQSVAGSIFDHLNISHTILILTHKPVREEGLNFTHENLRTWKSQRHRRSPTTKVTAAFGKQNKEPVFKVLVANPPKTKASWWLYILILFTAQTWKGTLPNITISWHYCQPVAHLPPLRGEQGRIGQESDCRLPPPCGETLSVSPLRRRSSLVAYQVWWSSLNHLALTSHLLELRAWADTPRFSQCWGSNPGLHACRMNALPTELLLQPLSSRCFYSDLYWSSLEVPFDPFYASSSTPGTLLP